MYMGFFSKYWLHKSDEIYEANIDLPKHVIGILWKFRPQKNITTIGLVHYNIYTEGVGFFSRHPGQKKGEEVFGSRQPKWLWGGDLLRLS